MINSAKFERIKGYFNTSMWNETMVRNAVGRWISEEEAEQILSGEEAAQNETGEKLPHGV